MKDKNKYIFDTFESKEPGFVAPENYFTQFEGNLQNNLKKVKSGFTVPNKYFEKIETNIINKVKNTGFTTPENYLKSIDNEILNKLEVIEKRKRNHVLRPVFIKVISYAVAASFLLFFGLNNYNKKNNTNEIESIEITEIENWIADDLISFNSFDIADTFDEISLYNEETYFSEEIIEYLDGINIEDLIIED